MRILPSPTRARRVAFIIFPKMVAFAFDPGFYLFFRTSISNGSRARSTSISSASWAALSSFQRFLRVFHCYLRRSDEEERAKIPQVLIKVARSFTSHDLLHIGWVCFHAVALRIGIKRAAVLIVHSLDIMMVEPFSFSYSNLAPLLLQRLRSKLWISSSMLITS